MTPTEFIRKWKPATLTERAAAQSHFIDLCALLGHDDPVAADPRGEWFTFEKGVTKSGGGDGFADVWKRNHFAWEYKKKKRNLDVAIDQLVRYAAALENPPLQVACDTDAFRIRTAWTNAVPETYDVALEELTDPVRLDILRAVFFDPEKLRPKQTRAALTKEAADKFSGIALQLQGRGTPEEVAHFVNQLVFCFFANSVKLLPEGFFPKMLKLAGEKPGQARELFDELFTAMEKGGRFGLDRIAWFNGGLFDGRRALALKEGEIALLQAAGSMDWSHIDPTIFGTLFERFLDPDKRKQIGAHYTDPEKIMRIVEPVFLRPLRQEWAAARAEIESILADAEMLRPRSLSRGDRQSADRSLRRLRDKATAPRDRFLDRLAAVQILDPACGSGNFLYLALHGIKDLENRVVLECEAMGLAPRALHIGPEILRGIDISGVAAELARTTIWIGDIQWRHRNGIYTEPSPILRKLDNIECRDALIEERPDGSYGEASWPDAEFIVGNPPFLGGKLMREGLGDDTVEILFDLYEGRVPPEGDLVTYWFEKTRAYIKAGKVSRAGLVATNSIRGGASRRVLDRIVEESRIFEAWSDEPWIVEGAAVRVSLICFGEVEGEAFLNGRPVERINPDLTAGDLDLTRARRLDENLGVSFMGDTKGGAFDVKGDVARAWLRLPKNPNGRSNADVLRPWRNGQDLTRRPADKWIIDFGLEMSESDASLYEAPFEHIKEFVHPKRLKNRRDSYRRFWWRHVEPRPALLRKLSSCRRYIATPTVAKHRLFVWLDKAILPDHQLIVIVRGDDTTFGILHSRYHEIWSLRLGTSLEDRPRYTPTTTFETFPFPEGLTPDIPTSDYADDPRAIAVAAAAKRLDDLRKAWLNPTDLVRVEPEVVPGYPDRVLPRDAEAAVKLRKRTLTKLYNQPPQWLDDAHRDLDAAVAAAYGWPSDISEEDALRELLDLNLARSGAPAAIGETHVIGRPEFEKISEIEEANLSESMKQVFEKLDREGLSPAERREAIKQRLKQVTP